MYAYYNNLTQFSFNRRLIFFATPDIRLTFTPYSSITSASSIPDSAAATSGSGSGAGG